MCNMRLCQIQSGQKELCSVTVIRGFTGSKQACVEIGLTDALRLRPHLRPVICSRMRNYSTLYSVIRPNQKGVYQRI